MSVKAALRPGLYAITDSQLLPHDRLLPAIEAALRGGATLVQYRDKHSPESLRLKQAQNLLSACRNAGVPLLINDDIELARRVGADGVHLGQTDQSLAEGRRRLGQEAVIGITCHGELSLAEQAAAGGASYLAFGRFFASGTKPNAPQADPALLSQARRLHLPVTAIGGITLENAPLLLKSGADLLAVVGGLFSQQACDADIEHRARQFAELIDQYLQNHPTHSVGAES